MENNIKTITVKPLLKQSLCSVITISCRIIIESLCSVITISCRIIFYYWTHWSCWWICHFKPHRFNAIFPYSNL